ncbi:MAG: EF-Tu/IF-2/RF-3 family GTPase, partial [Acutalibacteraceae bacterium]|nr:EF-Tu/IF-2/RF-3 family GTPase [Acutalibacteraceae bacterium]
LMLYSMVHIFPSADEARLEKAKDKNGNETEVHCHANGRLAAIVFKTVADPFVGKMSYFKVISGTLRSNSVAFNPRTGENERIGKLMFVRGGKTEDTDYVVAGDIGAVSKLSGIGTGDTLTSPDNPLELEGIEFQKPTVTMAIYPANKGEEDKISSAVKKMVEEDPALKLFHDHETHEYTVSGLGEQQLDVLLSRLKTRYGVDATLQTPKTAYRETIQKKVKVQGRYKKQSGGHGQFGDVWIEFEPCDSDTLVFEEKIFGGSVPKNFFPAVEKGLQDSVKKGVLAGYPVVGLKATLVDGSYHPVDSSEMSFKTAASLAYKAGLEQASPVLLEPIGILKASVPDDYMGDIIGDINKRRGRVLGMEPTEDGYQEISANIPVSESYDFSTALRSITQGRGSFTFEFERYERAPENVAQKIIENSNKE